MDFITRLPKSEGRINLLIIIDRLSKGVILEVINTIKVEDIIKVLLYTFY